MKWKKSVMFRRLVEGEGEAEENQHRLAAIIQITTAN